MIKLIVFDAGDILYDARQWFKYFGKEFPKFLKRHGGKNVEKTDEFWEEFHEPANTGKISLEEACSQHLIRHGIKPTKEIMDEYTQIDRKAYRKIKVKDPKTKDVLNKLKKLGYKIAILSDAPHGTVEKEIILESVGLDGIFDATFISSEIKHKKPDREAYETVLKFFRVKPEEAVFVGHDEEELVGAKAVGMKTISYQGHSSADFVVQKFEKIIKTVKELDQISETEYKNKWDEIYKKKSKSYRLESQLDYMIKVSEFFRKHNVKKVLDLGYGSGKHLVYLGKQNFEIYGLDVSEEALKIAKSLLEENNLRANLKVGSFYGKLPYEDDFFDAVISLRVLHHSKLEGIRKSIKEIERILKPNGLAFITVRKRIPKKMMTKVKWLDSRTYVPVEGEEKGVVHFLFNKTLLLKEFRNFKIHDFWIEPRNEKERKIRESWERYYCLLGEVKKN